MRTANPPEDIDSSTRRGIRTVLLSVLTSAVLGTVKIISGVLGNSLALVADGIESIVDVLGSLVVCGSLKIAAIPPDENHPYGHGKAEPLGAIVVAVALLAAAVAIAVQSIRGILRPQHAPATFTLLVLVAVVITKEILYRSLFRTGEQIGSTAMRADAWHHRSDALTSIAAFLGISISITAGEGYESADDWAALFACSIITFNGARLLRSALDEVMDATPGSGVENRIRKVAGAVGGVRAIEKCRVRKCGLALFAELHIEVDGETTVRQGHGTAHEVKDRLLEADIGLIDVAIHVEPAGQLQKS